MWEAIHAKVGCDQILHRAADSQEVSEFINRIVLENQHEARKPDQNTAKVQRQQVLNIPFSNRDIPNVPACFGCPQNDGKRPADVAFYVFAGVPELDEKNIECEKKRQRGDVRDAK